MVKKSICNMCLLRCGLNVHVVNNRIEKILPMQEHPFNTLCAKAQGISEWVHSPGRITHPMKRSKGGWKKISWDEAFEYLADKLTAIKDNYGPRSLVVYSGMAFAGTYDVRGVVQRFCDLYGTPNFTTGASYCHWATVIGHSLTFDYNTVEIIPDVDSTACILNWGTNPEESRVPLALKIKKARRRGAKLIVIDPRRTDMAKEADIYAQIRPGTDGALALSLLNVILEERLYDEDFVRKWTFGFDRLLEHIKPYSPEKVAEITWIPADVIRKIARTYATIKPATIIQYVSLEHSINGVQTSRAIAILMAITGNFDVQGGNIVCPRLKTAHLTIAKAPKEDSVSPQYPIFNMLAKRPTASPLAEVILSGKPYPVKALIVQGANPALTWPNSKKVKAALGKLDLLVVIDLFMTETAKLADLFLPATAFLERKQLVTYGVTGQLPLICRADPVIVPPGQCMDDWRIWCELGRKMGYGEYFPWDDADEIFEDYLAPTGITVKQLKEVSSGIFYAQCKEKAYMENGFNTPSGKVEIYSELLEKHGHSPLPTYAEPPESPISRPDLAKEFPLILITGPRVRWFTHSQHRNVSILRKRMPEPLIEINVRTAKNLGISDGSMVKVRSPRGEIKLKARVTRDIHPNVVSLPHGWSEANANELVDDMARDPISGYPSFRALLCQVTPDDQSPDKASPAECPRRD